MHTLLKFNGKAVLMACGYRVQKLSVLLSTLCLYLLVSCGC